MYPHPYVLNPVPLPKRRQSLRLWINPDDASTLEMSGELVDRVFDSSGNGNHAVKLSDSDRPTIGLVNGRKALRFDGVTDKMAGTTLLTGDEDFTVFAVAKVLSSAAEVAYFIIGNDLSYGLCLAVNTAANRPGALNGGIEFLPEASGALSNGDIVRQTLRRDEAPDRLYYTRGESIALDWTNNPGPAPYGSYALGRQSVAAQNLELCELIFYRENMHEAYRSEVNKYLNDRWGTT